MFSDITVTARTTVIWLRIYFAAGFCGLLASAFAVADPSVIRMDDEYGPIDWIDNASLIVLIIAGWLTLRWIHHANANAQQLVDDMTVSSRGNVIWFFIPIGNLWMPFAGVRESWQVSHAPAAWRSVQVPLLLRAWWACWLGESLLAVVTTRQVVRATTVDDMVAVYAIDMAGFGLSAVTTLLMIRIVRQLSAVQARAIAQHVFA